MLDKAVAAVKADKAKALDMFNKGEGGFKDRDLYPFCFNLSDGIFVPTIKQLLGADVRALKDPTGMAQKSMLPRRSRKVRSPRSAIRFQGLAPIGRRFPRWLSLPR
jgi:hypothetical protein